MKIKQKTVHIITTGLLLLPIIGFLITNTASAAECGGVQTSIISCGQSGDTTGGRVENSGAWGILLLIINIMTAGVGILAVGGIAYGSILYASAGDKAEQTKKAVGIITNVVIGIVAYGLMYGLLQYLVPGGVFN